MKTVVMGVKYDLADPNTVARLLTEHQKWRRGEPPYCWCEDPLKHKPMPLTPCELGKVVDAAVRMLKAIGRKQKRTCKKSA